MEIYQMPSAYGFIHNNPDRVIIHCMGQFIYDVKTDRVYYAKDWLDHLGISVHFTIDPDAGILQHRDINSGAYHAKFNNEDTVGLEFLVPGIWYGERFRKRIETPYLNDFQYSCGVWLMQNVLTGLPLYAHSEVDHRYREGVKVKVDPGRGFPKDKFSADIARC